MKDILNMITLNKLVVVEIYIFKDQNIYDFNYIRNWKEYFITIIKKI